ncbi:hypothetical protein [Flavivirga sp. 57AJ16]|uniref:hypothetical protein n=1 Tax=Flavivirga sp. 57AJ16 TaxID=3025307 RepID=UPI002364FE4D|nr:hypothetical protein [Flavivirga sp. 57AJ16]MDD7888156.1 hypothetical protein [Flavivirga sp. 57AJ16]
MIIVKVTYTTKTEFVEENQKNINLFMADFKKMQTNGFNYTSYLCEDGKTFIHLSHYINEEIQKELLQVPSFLFFQKQRDESGLENLPSIEVLKLVDTSKPFFN